jgi:hypothetical protein
MMVVVVAVVVGAIWLIPLVRDGRAPSLLTQTNPRERDKEF